MYLFLHFFLMKVNLLNVCVRLEELRVLLMTSAIFPVSGSLVSLLFLGNGRKKAMDTSLFSALLPAIHLICQTFPLFLWLAAHHTWDTRLCIYSLHDFTPCQIPLHSPSPGTQGRLPICP